MARATLFGPPGTGKTTTLSRWAKSAAAKHGGENIMICSLTRTAASEIASRDTGVPPENVGTLHAHAYRSIEDGPSVISKEQIDEWNEEHPEWAIPHHTATDDEATGGSASGSALARYDLLRATCRPIGSMPAGVQDFAIQYEAFKERHGVIDFTDMIQYAIDHIDCPMDYIIMDEAQDCSALEFKLLTKWADQAKGAVIAGDDDQAAYEWRGASVDAFLNFSPEDHRVLDQSYRIPAAVQRRADKWIRRVTNRKEKVYNPRETEGTCVELPYRKPEEVIRHALRQSGSVMILTTCGYMTHGFVAELNRLAEPFWNPYRMRGDYASTWNPLAAGGKRSKTITDSVSAFLSPPWTWRTAHTFMRELTGLPRGSKKNLEKERWNDELMPLETLGSILGESGLMAALDGNLEWFLANCKEDKKRRESLRYRVRVAQKYGVEGLTSQPKIIVGTIHSVKGGEANAVYLLPDLSGQGKEAWGLRAKQDPIIRQLYIGMTRASESLFLLRPAKGAPLTWNQ